MTQDTISTHRLVQAATRNQLNIEVGQRWAGVAVRLLFAAFPSNSLEAATWPTSARLLPQVLAATGHASKLAAEPATSVALLSQAVEYLWARAKLHQAKALLEQALAIGEARLGRDHPDVSRTLLILGP